MAENGDAFCGWPGDGCVWWSCPPACGNISVRWAGIRSIFPQEICIMNPFGVRSGIGDPPHAMASDLHILPTIPAIIPTSGGHESIWQTIRQYFVQFFLANGLFYSAEDTVKQQQVFTTKTPMPRPRGTQIHEKGSCAMIPETFDRDRVHSDATSAPRRRIPATSSTQDCCRPQGRARQGEFSDAPWLSKDFDQMRSGLDIHKKVIVATVLIILSIIEEITIRRFIHVVLASGLSAVSQGTMKGVERDSRMQ